VVAVSAVGGTLLSLNNQVTADIDTYLWSGQGVISGQYYEIGVVGEDDDIEVQSQADKNNIFVRLTGDQYIGLDFSGLININPFSDYQFNIPIAYYIQKWPLIKSLSCGLKDDGAKVSSNINMTLNANPLNLVESTECEDQLGNGDIDKSGLSLSIGDSGKSMLRLGVNELKINLGREITRTLYIYIKEDALPVLSNGADIEQPTRVGLSNNDLGGTANLFLHSILYADSSGNQTAKTHLDIIKSQKRDTIQFEVWSAGRDLTLSNETPTCQVMRATTTLPVSKIDFSLKERNDTISKTLVTIKNISSLSPDNYDVMIACGVSGDEFQEHFVLAVD